MQKPNIIFIMADDLGYSEIGCYGQEKIKTPNIDKMAEEGIRFTQCYAGSAICAPTRSVLMTGQHTGHTRIRGNFAQVGGKVVLDNGSLQRRGSLKKEDVTLAEILKKAGYATGITGKWGIAEPDTDGIPTRKGFDEWFGYLNQRRAHTYYPPFLWHNEKKVILERNKYGHRQTYSHNLFADFALNFIRNHRKESFFLYLPFTLPHNDLEIPDIGEYANEGWSEETKKYAAMVSLLDKDVGRILDLLKKLDIDDNTIVFFCSDNGTIRSNLEFDEIFNTTRESFRGNKGELYEGGLRVPMIVRWPGQITAGEISDAIWYFADFLPTAADLAGLEIEESDIDGKSILPVLLGKKKDLETRFLYWEFFIDFVLPPEGFSRAVRYGKWKGIQPTYNSPLELYDLEKDISEENNVAQENPEVVKKIEEYFETARKESACWPIKL